MGQPSYTARTAFSRGILPTLLFNADDVTASMLLTHRGKLVVQSFWRDMCGKLAPDEAAQADTITCHTKHLEGGKTPAIVVVLPYPKAAGEDYMACWVGLPYLGNRRYFTLGIPDDPAQSLTVLNEWRAASNRDFECVPHGTGPNPDPESFFAAVEKLLAKPAVPAAPVPELSREPARRQADPAPPAEAAKKKWWRFWE
jgi:hypothetical protein